jgi:diguanylate cyclase (GGDEF)-like protein/PAS domain S-box-containing protein
VFTIHTAFNESKRTTENVQQQAQALADNLASASGNYLLSRDYVSIEYLLLQTGRFPGVSEIQIIDSDGKPIGDIYRTATGEIELRYGQPALQHPASNNKLQSLVDDRMLVWRPVEMGYVIGWVRVIYDLGFIQDIRWRIWRDSIILSLLLIATTITLLIMVLRRPLGAIEQYTEFANRLDVDQGQEVNVDTCSMELEKLGNALNHASVRLNIQNREIMTAMDELERVAALAQYSPNMVISLNSDGKVVYCNPSVSRILGEDGNDIDNVALYLPDNIDELQQRCLADDASISEIETSINDRTFLWTFSAVKEQSIVHCYATNITKRKLAERARKESEGQYRLLFDSANDAIFLLQDGMVVDCNHMASTMLALPRESLLGQPLTKFAPQHQPGGKGSGKFFNERLEEAQAGLAQSFEWHCTGKSGNYFYSEVSLNRFDVSGTPWTLAIVRDITERKEAEEKLLHQANFDSLTELPNRLLAFDRLSQSIKQAHRIKRKMALMFIDIDHFKKVNDSLGHAAGDELLIEVSRRLMSCIREGDTAARLGGDEFLVILNDLGRILESEFVVERILSELAKPYVIDSRELFLSASIGITGYPNDSDDPTILLRNADTAMYLAKESGRNTYRYYTPELNKRAQARLDTETRLRKALDRNEFCLHYQPQIDIQKNKLIGAEALLRWDNKDLGLVQPDQFIPLAEDIGMMPEIGEWVLRQACQDALNWRLKVNLPLRVAVNVSPTQVQGKKFHQTVADIMEDYCVPSDLVELELTESLLIDDNPEVSQTLIALHEMGICLSLDDFGTGYSSLSYLKKYPFDVLKIDRSFVSNLIDNVDDAALCQAIIAMANSLNMAVVCEGVETEAQLDHLRSHGAQYAQGFYYSKPLPVTEFETFMLIWNIKHHSKAG